MTRVPPANTPPPSPAAQGSRAGPAQVVDAKYSADYQALNAAEEDQGRRTLVNTQARSQEGAQGTSKKSKEALVDAVSLDEERKRGKRGPEEESDQQDSESTGEVAAKSLGIDDGRMRLFEDGPEDALGHLELTDPNEMQRQLGPSGRFAQHAMLLAEARQKEGASRETALEYLAQLYLRCRDRAYANKALRDFGPATGIIDLYPLELVDLLLERHPTMLSKVSRGTIFTPTAETTYKGTARQPMLLQYPPELKLRGFAVKGGHHIGYTLEPADSPGTYQLTIDTPGKFTLLFSAIAGGGQLVVETARALIAENPEAEEGQPKPPPAIAATAKEEAPLTVVIPRRI